MPHPGTRGARGLPARAVSLTHPAERTRWSYDHGGRRRCRSRRSLLRALVKSRPVRIPIGCRLPIGASTALEDFREGKA